MLKRFSRSFHQTGKLFFPPKLYTVDHEWIEVKNGVGTIGISDYAQKALGDVVFVEIPSVGKTLKKSDSLGAIESVKAASDIYSPVSGEVVEVNSQLEVKPSLVNVSPEEYGWIAKIKISEKGDLENLLDIKQYEEHCKSN